VRFGLKRFAVRASLALLCLLALCACPDVRRPAGRDFAASGSVWAGGVERRAEPLTGAHVRAWGGEASERAESEAFADDAGVWRLTLGKSEGSAVLEVAREGWVPAYKAVRLNPFTEISWNVALEPAEELDCSSGACSVASNGLRIESPPEGAFGWARAFDPSTGTATVAGLETLRVFGLAHVALDAGDFDPDAGGFASDAGSGSTSLLTLRLPYESWKRLEDALVSTGRIEVPARRFEPETATWVEAGHAKLWSENGVELPESVLPALRSGTHQGGVIATLPLTTSGWWAVALPAASSGCIEGKVTVEGSPAAGVSFEAPPRASSASGSDGAFCAAVPVGASAEQATLYVQYAGLSYTPLEVSLPTQPGTCGGGCGSAGTVAVTAAGTITAEACKVTGTVKDPAGALLPGAVVVGLDESVSRGVFTTLCGRLGTRCPLAVAADENAHFELILPVQRGVQVSGRALVENVGGLDGVREGGLRLAGCPAAPVDLVLRTGSDSVAVEVTVAGGSIGWAPALPAAQVRAVDADGGVKWEVATPGGLAAPLVYGQVPAGAQQRTPASGSPAPLQSGDEVEVLLIGTDSRGYQYSGGASVPVP
jgi:hypothetical protein